MNRAERRRLLHVFGESGQKAGELAAERETAFFRSLFPIVTDDEVRRMEIERDQQLEVPDADQG